MRGREAEGYGRGAIIRVHHGAVGEGVRAAERLEALAGVFFGVFFDVRERVGLQSEVFEATTAADGYAGAFFKETAEGGGGESGPVVQGLGTFDGLDDLEFFRETPLR